MLTEVMWAKIQLKNHLLQLLKLSKKRAIEVLNKYAFAPNAFDADASLYPYLQLQRRGFGFFASTEDPKLSGIYPCKLTERLHTFCTLQHCNEFLIQVSLRQYVFSSRSYE